MSILACVGIFVLAILAVWGLLHAYEGGFLLELLIGVSIIVGITSCNQSNWYQAYERDREVVLRNEAIAERTPRVISQADGCKVYTFKAGGRWNYFTRCENASTVTKATYEEKCGKNCTKTIVETIPMEGVKKDGK